MANKSKRENTRFSARGRERPEWDTAALAQLVLSLARQRAAERQASKASLETPGEVA